MLIFAGLGNPGAQYAGNRHNIGFMALDAVARRHGFPPFRSKFQGLATEGALGGERVILLKPSTYMNESGRAVGEALRFYKVPLAGVAVFHDELDLAPGRLRVKLGGGNAGHNGLRSITALCGNDYKRVRLGIGHPGSKERVLGYVLGNFARSESDWLDRLCQACAENARDLVDGQDNQFQNHLHAALEPLLPATTKGGSRAAG